MATSLVNDLAGSTVYGPQGVEQLYGGERPIVTGRETALADILKYQLIASTGAGVTPFVDGTHTAAHARIAMQPALSGQACPYLTDGYMNEDMIVWPTGFGTTALRKQKLAGSGIDIEHLLPAKSGF